MASVRPPTGREPLSILIPLDSAGTIYIGWIIAPVIGLLVILCASYWQTIRAYPNSGGAYIVAWPAPFTIDVTRPSIMLLASEGWDRLPEKALRLALSLSPDFVAIHLMRLWGPEAEEEDQSWREQWHELIQRPAVVAGHASPRLAIAQAQYRNVYEPILKLVRELEQHLGDRRIAVLIPKR
jgi:hypothetical protein